MKQLIALLLICWPAAFAGAQAADSTVADESYRPTAGSTLDTVSLRGLTVTGILPVRSRQTSLNIVPYSLKSLQARSPYNLADALAQLPGISQMTTGNAISKPVVRGLYGNRVLILLSGLRFDNQQFQDEHGLGLSQIGINRVEVIRGPASLLYGTDAIGGVINIIEETPDAGQEGKRLDGTVRLYSNTLGTLTDAGISSRHHNTWWRLRGGYESHGDYSDGNGVRVSDSRNTGYYLKGGWGFRKGAWEMNNSYNGAFNQYGFILDSLNRTSRPEARWSRDMSRPHHNVLLNILSSQNTFRLQEGSVLRVNAGLQSNQRAEDEGGGKISLNMHLLSLLENARLERRLTRHSLLVLNQQFTYEINTNYGKRIIVPDARMLETNTSAFLRHTGDQLILEAGAGYTYKHITTLRTGALNAPGKANAPFRTGKPAVNGMAGFSYNPSAWLNLKGNVATGVRTGNLAELASEGLHEGTYRYEIGNPDLKPEQNINGDLTLSVSRSSWQLSISGFYNHFNNYIYLQPTSDTALGLFQIFRFVQQDARLYGGELSGSWQLAGRLRLNETFSLTLGKTADGGYLPFIPAGRSVTSLRYEYAGHGRIRNFYAEPECEYVLPQNHPARFEYATPDYTLLHLHTGATCHLGKRDYACSLSVRNLLNKAYADHLSRLRYFGINNPGINVVLSVGTSLDL